MEGIINKALKVIEDSMGNDEYDVVIALRKNNKSGTAIKGDAERLAEVLYSNIADVESPIKNKLYNILKMVALNIAIDKDSILGADLVSCMNHYAIDYEE